MLYTVYMWTVLAAATLFFGVGVIIFYPPFRRDRIYHWFQGNWGKTVVRLSGVPLTVTGLEKLKPGIPYVFMSNHQSYFDVLCLAAVIPRGFRFVAKRELTRIPVFGQAIKWTGHVIINRASHDSAVAELRKAAAKIRGGTSILVFPEGTRSGDHKVRPFKKGGFMLAMEAGAPVVPISIAGTQPMMPKGSFHFRRTRVFLVIGDPLPASAGSDEERGRLVETARNAIIQNFPEGTAEAEANKL